LLADSLLAITASCNHRTPYATMQEPRGSSFYFSRGKFYLSVSLSKFHKTVLSGEGGGDSSLLNAQFCLHLTISEKKKTFFKQSQTNRDFQLWLGKQMKILISVPIFNLIHFMYKHCLLNRTFKFAFKH
jgi:hypothetical protein